MLGKIQLGFLNRNYKYSFPSENRNHSRTNVFLETVAGHATSALVNAHLYALVERESITDGLTGIYTIDTFKNDCENSSHFANVVNAQSLLVYSLLMWIILSNLMIDTAIKSTGRNQSVFER